MNTKYLVIVSALTAILSGATAFATQDVFSTKEHYSQATSQVSSCGNDILPENVGCQNSYRQVQGDDNSCTSNLTVSNQVFPDERNNGGEVQSSQIPGEPEIPEESRGGVERNPFGPGDPCEPLPPE